MFGKMFYNSMLRVKVKAICYVQESRFGWFFVVLIVPVVVKSVPTFA